MIGKGKRNGKVKRKFHVVFLTEVILSKHEEYFSIKIIIAFVCYAKCFATGILDFCICVEQKKFCNCHTSFSSIFPSLQPFQNLQPNQRVIKIGLFILAYSSCYLRHAWIITNWFKVISIHSIQKKARNYQKPGSKVQ